jgi:uncharacterized cupin superfamily protein
VTEEAPFVLSGRAKVRTPEGASDIGPGDFVQFPPGGPAHQLVNDGAEPLVYVAMSAGSDADVVLYPEGGKVACAAGRWPTGRRFLFKEGSQVDYWDGEPGA